MDPLSYCLVAAGAELDGLRVGQFMVSRPIVLGPLLGWALGDAGTGAVLGAALEVLALDALPLGAVVPWSGAVAAAAAVWTALRTGAPGLSLAGGLAAGMAFRWADVGLRLAFGGLNAAAEAGVREGRLAAPAALLALAALAHALAAAAFLLLAVTALEPVCRWALTWPWADGFEQALDLLPALGVVAFLDALRPRA